VRRTGASQGEALATWGAWAVVLLAIVITYARLEPAELYHVSREGLGGGLSRALVEVVFPVALVLSVPWLAAEAGLYLPEGVWIMERPGLEADGTTIAAVHLGHHHGLDGALIVLIALLLTRPRLHAGPRATATRLYLSLAFAYGAVNMTQDYWNEQLVKRGWLDWRIPSALEPRPEPVWLAILGLAAVTAYALRAERAS
jgi:hypothetical protein